LKKDWFAQNEKEIQNYFQTDFKDGLKDSQVIQNREKYGLNELKAQKKKNKHYRKWNIEKKNEEGGMENVSVIANGITYKQKKEKQMQQEERYLQN